MNIKDIFTKFAKKFKGDVLEAWKAFVGQYKQTVDYKSKIKQENRPIGRLELSKLTKNHVCEIVFLRRRPERAPNRPEFRRMLCTNSLNLLDSHNGRTSLLFHFPRTPRRLNEAKHDIVVVWDIFMKDYRNVSMESCLLISTIPADDNFWAYYNDVIHKMSVQDQMQFMDNV